MTLLTPFQSVMLLTIIFLFIIASLILVLKTEKKTSIKFLWLLTILFFPILGSSIYYVKKIFE